ncbi:SCO family protein [Ferruginibacter sp. SUN002]|uniref:SCO family protein n=1 Tax=Ferruginibacter sp. SUN002 TaxID=2937789 RepID=UPI003D36F126
MKKKWVPYIVFFGLLLTGYFVFVFATNDFSQSNLPVINSNIPVFSFTNQDGKTITERDVEGKVYVVDYFFTTCTGICPRMNGNMRRVFDAYKNEKDFMVLSHTCMPETDSVSVLKTYQIKMLNGVLNKVGNSKYIVQYDSSMGKNITSTNWQFLTGNKEALYKLARHGYLIDNNKPDSAQNVGTDFLHTQFFALVDKQSRVRGIYDGLQDDEIGKLLKDIKGLLAEKTPTRSLKGF